MNNENGLKVTIASDIEYDNLIAEIYHNDQFIALMHQEEGRENLKLVFSPDAETVRVDWLLEALLQARKLLLV